jgi:hypothetical protein
VTYNQKLKGYPRGFKKKDFSKFNLKAWASVPISYDEKLDMSVYLANNNVEDFTMQYRVHLDKTVVSNPQRKIAITLEEGYSQHDIHTLQIRTDYGHKNIEGNIKHTNIELFDIFNNKINTDDASFIKQSFDIPSYEWTIHYIFMQVEKFNPLIGPKYWLSPFGIHENRVDIIHKLWQESGLFIPLCILSSNVYVKMIEKTYNDKKKEILDAELEEIVRNQILKSQKIESENPENSNVELLSPANGIFILPFHFFVPDEAFRYGSFRYSPDGSKQSEDRFEDMGIIFGKSDGEDKTMNYDPNPSPL